MLKTRKNKYKIVNNKGMTTYRVKQYFFKHLFLVILPMQRLEDSQITTITKMTNIKYAIIGDKMIKTIVRKILQHLFIL